MGYRSKRQEKEREEPRWGWKGKDVDCDQEAQNRAHGDWAQKQTHPAQHLIKQRKH